MGSSGVPANVSIVHGLYGAGECTKTAGVEGPHVEDVDALHLSEDFETLETGRLLGIGGNGTGLSTLGEEVVHGLDRCTTSAMDRARAAGDAMSWPGREKAAHVQSSFLKPSRTLGESAEWPASFLWVASAFASPAQESMGRRGQAPGSPLRRTKVVVKVRRAMAAGAARLAAAIAERWRNMARAIGVEWRGGRAGELGER